MKLNNIKCALTTLLLAGGLMTAQAQTDVTADYIINPSFEYSAEGVKYTKETALSNGQKFYGWTAPTLNSGYYDIDITPNASATNGHFGTTSPSEGNYFFYNRQGWGSVSASLSQTITSLPVGKYYLSVDYKAAGAGDGSKDAFGSKLGIKVSSGSSELVNLSSLVSASNPGTSYFTNQGWKQMGAWFTVTSQGTILIELTEYLQGNNKRADICLDNVRLYKWDTNDAVNYANASASSPMDITSAFITNPYFDSDVSGWTSTTGYQNNARATNQSGAFSSYFYENWNGSAQTSGKMSYTIASGLPEGNYRLTMAAWGNKANGAGLNVFAGSSKTPVTSTTPSFYTVETAVTNGSLEIGLELSAGNPNNWIGIDNVRLEYLGVDLEPALATLNTTITNANALVSEKMGATELSNLNTEITNAQKVYNGEVTQTLTSISEATTTLQNAISAAQNSVALYETNKDAIDAMYALIASTNVYTTAAYNTYKSKADGYQASWDASTLAETVDDPSTVHGWHAANEYDDFLLSAWTIGGEQATNFDKSLYINTWSTEGTRDGSNFLVPFYEYYKDGAALDPTTIQATVTGLTPNGSYKVTAWTRVQTTGAGVDPTGITLKVGSGLPVDVTEGAAVNNDTKMTHAVYDAYGSADASGNLTITYTVAEGNTIHWLSFRDIKYEEQEKSAEQLAMENALAAAQLINKENQAPAVQTLLTDALAAAESANDVASWGAAAEALTNATQAVKETEEPYAALKELIVLCENDLSNSVAREADATTYETAIEAAKTTANEATTADALNTAYTELDAAHKEYVKVAYPNADHSFDLTFMMKDPAVTSKDNWTNGSTNVNQQYTNAPDNTYLDAYQVTKDMYQTIEGLPEGLYAITAATRASSGLTTAYIYTKTNDDKKTATTHNIGGANNTLGNGWGWTSTEPINVVTGKLTIGFYLACGTSQWAGADNFTLARTYDATATQNALKALIAKATTVNVAPMGTTESAALEAAIAGADATSSNPFDLNKGIEALNKAIADAATWLTAYNEAKAPLVSALERFESDYNDGENGALQPMSTEAWNALLTAVQTAAEAKDVTNNYANFAADAEALNAALNTADGSIALYARYTSLINGLTIIDASYFTTVVTEVNTAAYQATDAKVTEAIGKLDEAFIAYTKTKDGDFDVSGVLGTNLDFETAQGVLSNGAYAKVYEQTGWINSFNTQSNTTNTQYINRESKATDRTDAEKTANMLYMRAKWQDIAATMQIEKFTVLPAGNYTITFWMKQTQTAGQTENLNYYAINGTRTPFSASSSWEKKTVSFEIKNASNVDLSFGFKGGQNERDVDIFVDDISLVCNTETAYRRTLAAAKTLTASLAVQAALDEFEYTEAEEKAKSNEEITLAINVLTNAMTIANNAENATSLWKNADFTGGTVTYSTSGAGVKAPADWQFAYTLEGWYDTFVNGDVFNLYAGTVKYAELSQTVTSLPNGTYKISADMKTFTNTTIGGNSLVALYGAPNGGGVGRSVNVGNVADEFANYAVYVKVTNNELTTGFRSDKNYFQVKNFQVEFVADNLEEVDNGKLYQDAYINRNNMELDLTAYANANDCKVYVPNANGIIYANEGAVANAQNVVVNGTCDNLVLTDGNAVGITNTFNATAATYSRNMSNNWGTIILPYAISSDENITLFELTEVTEGEEGVMTFSSVETLAANQPGAFKKASTDATNVTFAVENTSIAITNKAQEGAEATDWIINGVYGTEEINAAEQSDSYYYIANDKFWKATGKLTVNPFRAYFTTSKAASARYRIDFNDGTTGINGTETGKIGFSVFGERGQLVLTTSKDVAYTIYSINGQLVVSGSLNAGETTNVSVSAGVYIVNGAKVIVR